MKHDIFMVQIYEKEKDKFPKTIQFANVNPDSKQHESYIDLMNKTGFNTIKDQFGNNALTSMSNEEYKKLYQEDIING